MQTRPDRTKPWGLGLFWGYGEGKNRGRGWCWGVFCLEDMGESSTQFLSLLWISPLGFFFAFISPGRRHVEQMLKLVALGGGCGVRWPGWGFSVKGDLQSTEKHVQPLFWWQDVPASQSCSFLRCSWGPGIGRELGCISWSTEKKSYHPCAIWCPQRFKPSSWLCKGSHCPN